MQQKSLRDILTRPTVAENSVSAWLQPRCARSAIHTIAFYLYGEQINKRQTVNKHRNRKRHPAARRRGRGGGEQGRTETRQSAARYNATFSPYQRCFLPRSCSAAIGVEGSRDNSCSPRILFRARVPLDGIAPPVQRHYVQLFSLITCMRFQPAEYECGASAPTGNFPSRCSRFRSSPAQVVRLRICRVSLTRLAEMFGLSGKWQRPRIMKETRRVIADNVTRAIIHERYLIELSSVVSIKLAPACVRTRRCAPCIH